MMSSKEHGSVERPCGQDLWVDGTEDGVGYT